MIKGISGEVSRIYLVDDACPEGTGDFVIKNNTDPRVVVLKHERNLGVGGATITGYRKALAEGAHIIVKIDSDGQMDPTMIHSFVKPLQDGRADYTKGNRFYFLEYLKGMPRLRLFGNAILSLVVKFSTGYWDVVDPANGYTAIHGKVLELLPLDKLDKGYFFEEDILFRLNIVRAVVLDIPQKSIYAGETSSMNLGRVAFEFPCKHLIRFMKRIFYLYFLREFNVGTVQLIGGTVLLFAGGTFGIWQWVNNVRLGVTTPSGTVMLAALPVLLGFNLLLSVLNYDIASVPRRTIHRLLQDS